MYIVLVTLICCMVPFFGDFAALVGAIGFTPLVRTCSAGMFYWRIRLELRACLFKPTRHMGSVQFYKSRCFLVSG